MPKQLPYPFEDTQMEVNKRTLVCGTTGSGKTNALLEYLDLSPRTFAKVIVCHKEEEALYSALQDALEGKVTFYTDLAKLPKLTTLREDMDDQARVLLVIDDYVTQLGDSKYAHINEYFIRGRKKNVTVFCLCQSYYAVPKIIRQQMSYLLLFRITSRRDLDLIMDDFSSPDVPKELLRKMYKAATKENLNFFKINCEQCPLSRKFSRNFTEFFEIQGEEDSDDDA